MNRYREEENATTTENSLSFPKNLFGTGPFELFSRKLKFARMIKRESKKEKNIFFKNNKKNRQGDDGIKREEEKTRVKKIDV